MEYKRLFIFVEGPDDERFFKKIVIPLFESTYDNIKIIKYAQESNKWRKNFLTSIILMNSDYIYVSDIDQEPCVTAKKQKIKTQLDNIDTNKITIVIKEIESWYIALVCDENSNPVGLKPLKIADDITKEEFNKLMPSKYDSRVDFMSEILKITSHYVLSIAKQKNKSLKYFIEKYNLQN